MKISDAVGCPAVCGFWRPTILIPRRLVGRLDEEQLQLVFVHELAHWKRWDLQLNLLQTVLQVVYFYNPAVWIANFVLRRLREEAVDDAVLVALAAPVERYSHTLLDVAAHAARPLELNVRLIGILESRKALANRIQRLATSPLPKSARLGLWGFAGVVIVGLALLPMAGSRPVVAENRAEKGPKPPANQSAARPSTEIAKSSATVIPAATPALAGCITDESGQPVSDAIVRLINVANRAVQETATNRDGHMPSVAVGLRVSMQFSFIAIGASASPIWAIARGLFSTQKSLSFAISASRSLVSCACKQWTKRDAR